LGYISLVSLINLFMSENNFDDEAKKRAEEEKNLKEVKDFLLKLFGFMAVITIASGIYKASNPPKEPETVITTTKTEAPKRDNEEATLDQDCVNRVTQEIADKENDYGDRQVDDEEAIKYALEIAQRCKK
jgi:hypothetical protein